MQQYEGGSSLLACSEHLLVSQCETEWMDQTVSWYLLIRLIVGSLVVMG